ncbi:MAG: ABC transporter permease [Janthinobacterium lividum]
MTCTTWTIQRVPSISGGLRVVAYLASGLAAVLVTGILLSLLGLHPLVLGGQVLHQSLGSRFGFEDLLLLASPLVMCGLSVAMMLRVGLWNIGADGQFFVGAICAAGVGLYGPHWPLLPMLVLMGIAASLGGAAWIAVPALARLTLGTSEIITTLLLNFVARLFVDYLATGPWRDRHSSVTAQSPRIPYAIPKLPHGWHLGGVHWGIAVSVALAIIAALAFRLTRWGYELRICGANRNAAAYAGMRVQRRLLEAMLIGGAIAGIGGMLELAGTVHRLQSGLSNSYGYVGIIVAVLAASSPIGTIVTGLLMALVLNAGTVLQTHGIPASASVALTGLILLFAAIGERLAHYRVAVLHPRAPVTAPVKIAA